ncbi:hypothetical protein [Luteimonas huabeiensis]|uniref:hypothetical protein n=1 Tax=Luteimonas huabeiensis TaxID=1244513 RepID=UPI0004BB0C08|nr:hypothetical protein [Luteimonas huabeiensis]
MTQRPGPIATLAPPLAAALLAACAHGAAPSSSTPAQESAAMSPPETAASAVQPTLTAEQALTRLLELIRTTGSVQEFTPKKLQDTFGLPVWTDENRYGFGERLNSEWSHGGMIYKEPNGSFRFSYSVDLVGGDPFIAMTEVCQMDFAKFSAHLEGMGFSSEPNYGEHGRLMSHLFDRPGMRVEVFPRGEANDTLERIKHKCVKMVIVPGGSVRYRHRAGVSQADRAARPCQCRRRVRSREQDHPAAAGQVEHATRRGRPDLRDGARAAAWLQRRGGAPGVGGVLNASRERSHQLRPGTRLPRSHGGHAGGPSAQRDAWGNRKRLDWLSEEAKDSRPSPARNAAMTQSPGPLAILTLPLAAALLAACAHGAAPSVSIPAQESAAMSPPETTAPAVQPMLTAEQALTRLLELIRTTETVREFTPERLREAFGLEVWKDGPERYGFGERLTLDWSHGGLVYKDLSGRSGFRYSLTPRGGDPSLSMVDVCRMDFPTFSAGLEALGFSSSPSYGEHDRLMSHIFDRPGMRVEVVPEGERVWTEERGGGRTCVKMVIVTGRCPAPCGQPARHPRGLAGPGGSVRYRHRAGASQADRAARPCQCGRRVRPRKQDHPAAAGQIKHAA